MVGTVLLQESRSRKDVVGLRVVLTRVFELSAHHVVDEQRLSDHLDLLHALHRLGDQKQVGEQEAVHIHLEEEHTAASKHL